MWNYEKRLEYPVNIKTPNAKIAQIIISQYGGRECKFSKHPKKPDFMRVSGNLANPRNPLNQYNRDRTKASSWHGPRQFFPQSTA